MTPSPPDPRLRQDHPAITAASGLVKRTGTTGFQYGWTHDDKPVDEAEWWGQAQYSGGITIDAEGISPDAMCDALVQRLLHGGVCKGCDRTSVVLSMRDRPIPLSVSTMDGKPIERTPEMMEAEGYCGWELRGTTWTRWCGWSLPDPDCSRERLARALAEIRAHPQQIGAARAGRYDDFESPLAFPVMTLVEELLPYGDRAKKLIERVKNGEFDASEAEARKYMTHDPELRDLLLADALRTFTKEQGPRG